MSSTTSLFDVYLRLRPPPTNSQGSLIDKFIDVDQPCESPDGSSGGAAAAAAPTHITIKPPSSDNRKRAVEKFAFTKIFDEDASQLDVFRGTSVLSVVEGVLGASERRQGCGRDGLLATLGMTGSGKSHTTLGSKTQRGLTQMTLDVLFKSIGQDSIVMPAMSLAQLASEDVSDAQLVTASQFFDAMYGNSDGEVSRMTSRAQTPMSIMVRDHAQPENKIPRKPISTIGAGFVTKMTRSTIAKIRSFPASPLKDTSIHSSIYPTNISSSAYPMLQHIPTTRRHAQNIPIVASLPKSPSIEGLELPPADRNACYAIVVSMYEVYNDRIFDLLSGSAASSKTTNAQRELRKRALLFKGTETSPDRKVVCGLRKVVCGSFDEALLVLEAGLAERRVAGTGSNAVSSRSHGFFCVEVKKRSKASTISTWSSSTLTVVDLAGSERARIAKTAGTTLVEAGKINESLMYLGQCMQMQSDNPESKPALVPFRQCKLTELLFSNSFSTSSSRTAQQQQKAVMIVTADPRGDFNATSQILRYSALAREVTVPRIPSVTSTILSGSMPTSTASVTRSQAAAIAATEEVNEELAILRLQLEEETRRRRDAESSWARAEERLEEMEAEIREECWSTFEERLVLERERWLAAWEEERERVEGHVDRKLDVLMSGMTLEKSPTSCTRNVIQIHEDVDEKNETKDEILLKRLEEAERENEVLREKVSNLHREQTSRTPSRKIRVLKSKKWNVDFDEDDENQDMPALFPSSSSLIRLPPNIL